MNFFNDLQKKPVAVRKKIMWLGAITFGLIIFFLWLFIFPHSSTPSEKVQKNNQKMGEEFAKLKEEIGKQTSEINLGDLSENLKNKNGPNEKKRINEVPRLPLE
jgi:hypothetical protein